MACDRQTKIFLVTETNFCISNLRPNKNLVVKSTRLGSGKLSTLFGYFFNHLAVEQYQPTLS